MSHQISRWHHLSCKKPSLFVLLPKDVARQFRLYLGDRWLPYPYRWYNGTIHGIESKTTMIGEIKRGLSMGIDSSNMDLNGTTMYSMCAIVCPGIVQKAPPFKSWKELSQLFRRAWWNRGRSTQMKRRKTISCLAPERWLCKAGFLRKASGGGW